MRLPVLVLLASVGCGAVASTEPEKGATPPDPASTDQTGHAPTAGPAVSAAPPAATAPPTPAHPPAGACGVLASTRSFSTPDDQAVALHGLWIGCATDTAPALCPASDASMFFGSLDAMSNPSSRAVACGHVSTHGDAFIRNAAYEFTYAVGNVAAPGSSPSYVLRAWNDATDLTFALSYRDDAAMTGYLTAGTITLGESDGRSGTLRHSAFTTF
jgi:hypothetical protein